MARPTKYSKAMQQAADDYVNGGHEACGDVVPSVAGLACELGVTRSTMYEWQKHHCQFSDTLGRLESVQERMSLSGGLTGKLNSTIVKLLLANHGYTERVSQDHKSSDGSMTPPTVVQIVSPDDNRKG